MCFVNLLGLTYNVSLVLQYWYALIFICVFFFFYRKQYKKMCEWKSMALKPLLKLKVSATIYCVPLCIARQYTAPLCITRKYTVSHCALRDNILHVPLCIVRQYNVPLWITRIYYTVSNCALRDNILHMSYSYCALWHNILCRIHIVHCETLNILCPIVYHKIGIRCALYVSA